MQERLDSYAPFGMQIENLEEVPFSGLFSGMLVGQQAVEYL